MIEITILSSLIHDEDYAKRVLPYIKKDYFNDIGQQVVFKLIRDFSLKYNKPPTIESLQIELESSSLAESPYESATEILTKIDKKSVVDPEWLLNQTETFCQRQALVNAISAGSELLIKNKSEEYGSILTMVQDAMTVSFDNKLGHDYLEDAEARFASYHDTEEVLECDLHMLNVVTGGGLLNRTLTVFIAPTNGGKSIMLCHLASSYLLQGKNVVYFTLEMDEGGGGISKRVDANILDIDINMLKETDPNGLYNRITRLRSKNIGRLIVKQYPTSTAHVGHFRHFLNELKLKKGFSPDVIIVDYLNICASARGVKNANSYENAKAIAEDLRGLGVEYDCRIVTATQVNRDGADSSDFGLTQTSESFGVPMTADYMFALITTDQLEQLGRMKIKQLKNRHNDKSQISSFLVNIDRSRMRFSDCSESTDSVDAKQQEIDSIPDTRRQQKKDLDERFQSLLVDAE